MTLDTRLPHESPGHADAAIAISVRTVLNWSTSLEVDAISVRVEGGWIILQGEAQWPQQRQAAVGAVRFIDGVMGVSSHIIIRSHGDSDRPDEFGLAKRPIAQM